MPTATATQDTRSASAEPARLQPIPQGVPGSQTTHAKKVGKAVEDAIKSGAPNVDLSLLPNLNDMSPESITKNVHAINSLCTNPRQKFLFEKLVSHIHDFAREVSLTSEEWMTAIQFLTATGKICSDLRQEFILLSDIVGLSVLVDSMNHPTTHPATEAAVLGPFHTEETQEIQNGDTVATDGKGEYMFCEGRVLDMHGKPIAGCIIDTWETDDEGLYDTQYEDFSIDCRGRLVTDARGYYSYRAILPTPYPIPNDGPVGKLLRTLNRHVFRPAHMHMMFQAKGYEKLITQLFFEGDPYLQSDAVFAVKSSLIVDPVYVQDEEEAKKRGFPHGPYYHLQHDYVLLTLEEAEEQKRQSLPHFYETATTTKQ
ncbi:hypothetical protein JCM8097_001242 [Rhodosporidiobolus ruineniae]